MQKEPSFFSHFAIFFVLSLVIFLLANVGVLIIPQEILQTVSLPLQKITYQVVANSKNNSSPIMQENLKLTEKLADYEKLQKENQALRDQFQTSTPASSALIPATVVGAPGFLPGVSGVESLIIDKGSSDGLQAGYVVVYQQNVVGKVTKVTPHLSQVSLATSENSSFTAKTDKGAIGVVHGIGNEQMMLGNVVLSQNLNSGDLVTTKGDVDTNGFGYPPDLIVGKITSVNRQPSSLFQSASVKSLINFETLTTVFVIVSK